VPSLVESDLISPEQLEIALERQKNSGEPFTRVLVALGYISEGKLQQFIAERFALPTLSLIDIEINPKVVELLPVEIAHRYTVMPIFHTGSLLTVAMEDPFDFVALDEIAYHTKLEVERAIATRSEIEAAIDKYYSLIDTMGATMDRIELQSPESSADHVLNPENNEGISSSMPVVDLVNSIIVQAVKSKASDIHLEGDEQSFVVRYRIDGLMREAATLNARIRQPVITRIKVMSNMDVSERRLPQDGRFRINLADRVVDCRVSSLPAIDGEKVVIRILDKSNMLLDLSQMGFSQVNYEKWLEIIDRPEGLILITGPTGSGKTTTLYAVLNKLNSPEKSIVTVEDPVEYRLREATQVQINEKAGLVFANALRSIVRQNPNILMVGEIRDLATAEISIRASLTGHLVLSTLHTSDAPVAVGRLIDMGVEPYLVSSSVTAVLAQRLVRLLCNRCKESVQLDIPLIKEFQERNHLPELTFFQGKGCPRCNNKGFIGRTAIHELMLVNSELKELISQKASHLALRRATLTAGMVSLMDDGLLKASKGITTIEEVLRVCHNEDSKINQYCTASRRKDGSPVQI